jgi:hypothetical protein
MLKVTYMMMHWNLRNVMKATLSIFDSPLYQDLFKQEVKFWEVPE